MDLTELASARPQQTRACGQTRNDRTNDGIRCLSCTLQTRNGYVIRNTTWISSGLAGLPSLLNFVQPRSNGILGPPFKLCMIKSTNNSLLLHHNHLGQQNYRRIQIPARQVRRKVSVVKI